MNAADAFSYSVSGSLNEDSVRRYADYVQVSYQNAKSLGGWLGTQAEKTLDRFNDFVSSRTWELGKRLLRGSDKEAYVGAFDIGYVGSLESQQSSAGFMRNYIMANPEVMQLYLDGVLDGYGGDVNHHCSGVGIQNTFYRKATDGVVLLNKENDVHVARHRHFNEAIGSGLSQRERIDIQRTWLATNHHLAKSLFDPTSPDGNERKKPDEEV